VKIVIPTVEFGNIEQLTQAITPNTAAIILEPIQGEGGVNKSCFICVVVR
jgi:ornithine--oxo-acid transaminase